MKTKGTETRSERVWFGLNAKVAIGPGFSHKAGVGGFMIPHPPAANWLLRMGLPDNLRRGLSFAHEFAHFQTAPVLLTYMLVQIFLLYEKGHAGIGEVLFLFISGQAAWEIMSEGLLLLKDPVTYRQAYEGKTRIPQVLFWAAGVMLAVAGWLTVLHT